MGRSCPPCLAEYRAGSFGPRGGRSPSELAREFEPSAQSITNWVLRPSSTRDTVRV